MGARNPIRILIADDHSIVREGLSSIIQQREDMTVVGFARDGRELIEQHALLQPDVTIVDLRMPEIDGIQATRAIRSHTPGARIIILTLFDDDEDVFRGLRAGAQAYILKSTSGEDLVEAIRAVHAGQKRLPASVAAILASHVTSAKLTPREREVLILMAEGQSNKQIASALFVSSGTVKAHVHSILAKLGATDRTQAVTVALKRGLVQLG